MKPKILLVDIETAPILAHVWGLFDQNVSLNQVKSDWHLLSWSAKWLGDKEIMYMDQRKSKDVENDKNILKGIWELLDEADIVIGQNSIAFDTKKLNARFMVHKMGPPSPFRQIDTMRLAKKHFAFTSNKLAYMTEKFCTKYKKLEHKKFPGFELWSECLKGNLQAWKEMEKYNKHDVLALEELYLKLAPWGTGVDFSTFSSSLRPTCNCGSTDMQARGFNVTTAGKFQRYQCRACGAWCSSKDNLLSKVKRASLLKKL